MKNIQVIDSANNCVYDIFAAEEEEFSIIFPNGTDIAFIDEVFAREDEDNLCTIFKNIWQRKIPKTEVNGLHGTLFYGIESKKIYYPSRRDSEAINPDGSSLR